MLTNKIYGLCRLITFLIMLPILLAIQEKKDNHILIFQFMNYIEQEAQE